MLERKEKMGYNINRNFLTERGSQMNQKELNEIRRRLALDKNCISKVYGCFVNRMKLIAARLLRNFWQDTSSNILGKFACEENRFKSILLQNILYKEKILCPR